VLPGKKFVDTDASPDIELTCRLSDLLHVSILEHWFRGFCFLNYLLLLLRHGYGPRVCAKAWQQEPTASGDSRAFRAMEV
jgi:hypothetical protein